MQHFLEAHPIKVIKRRENGSGIIEIPIMATTDADLELDTPVDAAMLQSLVDNFAAFPIVPVGVSPHKDFDERSGFSIAFIESVELRGDELFGRLDIIAGLFHEVVELGGWRGFSVEIAHNLKTQAKSIDGWTLTGGVFTNRPAVDAHFKIAAEATSGSDSTGTYTAPLFVEESEMEKKADTAPANKGAEKTVSVAFHDTKMQERADTITALEGAKLDLTGKIEQRDDEVRRLRLEVEQSAQTATEARNDKATAEARANRLEAETKGLRDANGTLEVKLTESAKQVKDAESVNLSIKVKSVIEDAIADKVAPANFEGYEGNPADWMHSIYANFEAFEKSVALMRGTGPKVGDMKPVSSGHNSKKGQNSALEGLSEKEAKLFKKHSTLGVDFSACTNADEARALLDAKEADGKN